MAQASRDQNFVPTLLGVSSVDGTTPITIYANPTTHRLLVDIPSGSGTVSDVSVVTANGFAGTVATSTTTPAITLSTTVTGILSGNGTAISAASTTGSGDVVLATSPTLVTPALGTPSALVGTNITGTASALNIGGTAAIATTVTAADESADTTCFPLFVTAATGNLGPKTNAGLSFNSSTGALTATSFVGSFAGNAATVTFANEATDTSCFLAFATAASGNLEPKTNANMTFNSNTGVVTFASSVLTTTDINGGTIDGVTIGGASAGAITGTTITANTGFMPDADDGAYLGQSGTGFADLFLASGAVINWNAGNATITHSAALLTFNTAITVGTSNAITCGTIELGAASDTTVSRSSAGVIAVEGVVIPSISSTNTLTNKRITKRTGTTTSSATPTINTDNVDFYSITAQTEAITSFTTNLSGTPTEGQTLWIAITGTAARAITWGASFEASTVALPTTTVTTNRLDVGFIWNTVTSKWRCIASA